MLTDHQAPCRPTQVNVEALPEGPQNPYGNAFAAVETTFKTEKEAQRVTNPASARTWKVSNPNVLHPATGTPLFISLCGSKRSC